jgi:ascorbate-specific PTS system EIIC-type component UlaA
VQRALAGTALLLGLVTAIGGVVRHRPVPIIVGVVVVGLATIARRVWT